MMASIPLFLFGLLWLNLSVSELNLFLHAENYQEAELLITRFHYEPPKTVRVTRGTYSKTKTSSNPNQIEGIIQGSEENVFTDDRHVYIAVEDGPNSIVSRTPTRDEVEGKVFKVLHWPNHEPLKRWWHPPTTMTGSIPSARNMIVNAIVLLISLGGGAALFLHSLSPSKASESKSLWPGWTGIALIGAVMGWPFFMIVYLVFAPGVKLNKLGTERLSVTTVEWLLSLVAMGMAAIVPVCATLLLFSAIKIRFAKR